MSTFEAHGRLKSVNCVGNDGVAGNYINTGIIFADRTEMSEMTEVSHQQWGEVTGLGAVEMWVLQSSQVRVEVVTLGAIIRSVWSKGKDGQMEDVTLGFNDVEGYMSDTRYLGATVGRVANRIAKGRFVVEGKEYQLDINNGPNALHGGLRGFNKAIWLASAVEGGVQLSHTSPDGDQGYPGEVQVSVSYTLQGETLTVEYQARSTKTTPINLTNHSYFNLNGQGAVDIYDHQVSISAQSYLPVDDTAIPTGEIRPVDGTPFDLRKPVLIGPRLKEVPGPGFDHNFCLSSPGDTWTERHAARFAEEDPLKLKHTTHSHTLYTQQHAYLCL
ncbi:hypothetical protein ABVT39_021463 [Epinephelus coioides]